MSDSYTSRSLTKQLQKISYSSEVYMTAQLCQMQELTSNVDTIYLQF